MGSGINAQVSWTSALAWIVVVLPTALGGFHEDITQILSVRYRLGLTALFATFVCVFMDISVTRLGVPWLDTLLLAVPWAGIGFAFGCMRITACLQYHRWLQRALRERSLYLFAWQPPMRHCNWATGNLPPWWFAWQEQRRGSYFGTIRVASFLLEMVVLTCGV